MKPKSTSTIFDQLRHKFPPALLYRSDLEEVLRIAEARSLKACISDDRSEFDSLDDLKENRGEKVRNLNIRFAADDFFGTADLTVGADGVILLSDKKDKLVLFWQEAKGLLEKRAPWYARLMRPIVWMWVAVVIYWIPEKAFSSHEWPEPIRYIWLGCYVFFIAMSVVSWVYLRRSRGVSLKREHEVQGFWERNGDKIILLAIGAVLGAFVAAVASKLFGN